MSQQPSSVVVVHQRAPSNGLGIAGFIVSLLGLIGTCGLLSPIGLLMSFVAVFKRPRGFALAGLIIGLVGSIWAIIAVFVIGLGALAAMVGIGVAPKHVQAFGDMQTLDQAVRSHMSSGSALPADFKGLTGAAGHTTDPWGNSYRIIKKDNGKFDIVSDGPDGEPSTSDDLSWVDFQAGGAEYRAKKAAPRPD